MKQHIFWEKFSQQLSSICLRYSDILLERKCRLGVKEIFSGVLTLKAGSNESYKTIFESWDRPPAASTFCVARSKIPAFVFGEIRDELREFWDELVPQIENWKGFDVFAIDGSTLNLPPSLADSGFHQAAANQLPQGLLSVLFRIFDRSIIGLDFSSDQCERRAEQRLTKNLGRGDLLICDKGYLSFGMLCELERKQVKAIFCVQQGQSFKEVSDFRESDENETTKEIWPSEPARTRARKGYPDINLRPQKLRFLKFVFDGKTEVLATTLFDESITANEIIELYRVRWRIEEFYKAFKTTLAIETFHSKNPNSVEQELHASAFLWNCSRMLEEFIPKSAFKKTK